MVIYVILPKRLLLVLVDEPSTRWNPASESVAVSRVAVALGDARQLSLAFARMRHMSRRNVWQGASVIATVMMHVEHDSSRFPYGSDCSMGSTSGKKKQKHRFPLARDPDPLVRIQPEKGGLHELADFVSERY